MPTPIKHSTTAAVLRKDKTEMRDAMTIKDAVFDKNHSINDEFGYPMWAHPKDQSNDANNDGAAQPVCTDSDGDDSDQ